MGRKASINRGTRIREAAAIAALLAVLLVVFPLITLAADAQDVELAPSSEKTELPVKPEEGEASQSQAFHELAPGDNLKVKLYAVEPQEFEVVVDALGEIALPEVGHVPVAGMRADQASRQLEERYAEFYRNPVVDITIVSFGRIKVMLFGPMVQTQLLSLENPSTLYDAVYYHIRDPLMMRQLMVVRGEPELYDKMVETMLGGGMAAVPAISAAHSDSGTIQSITQVMNYKGWLDSMLDDPGVTVQYVDSADLFRNGNLPRHNFQLKQGDLIHIAAPEKVVEVRGATIEGFYEILEGETMLDALALAGYTAHPGADLRNVVLERYDECSRLNRLVVNLVPAADDASYLSTIGLEDRDVIRIVNYVERVFVMGEVKSAGVFEYDPKFQVLDYITLAGGKTAEGHDPFVAIVRHPRDLSEPCRPATVIEVDLRRIYKGDCPDDYTVLPGDVVYVPPKGANITMSNVTSALNTLFLGINFFDNLNDNNK